jgi:hypothetical protein
MIGPPEIFTFLFVMLGPLNRLALLPNLLPCRKRIAPRTQSGKHLALVGTAPVGDR